jgi:hypothetical protein
MPRQNQRGQALPAVLAIMLVLVLLAGGATMAVSAVLRQQDANRASTRTDVASQNAVTAIAANLTGCAQDMANSPDTLLKDGFLSSDKAVGTRWQLATFPTWTLQPPSGLLLTPPQTGFGTATPDPDFYQTAPSWSDYSVSVVVKPQSITNMSQIELDAYYVKHQNGSFSAYFLQLQNGAGPPGVIRWTFGRIGSKPAQGSVQSALQHGTPQPETLGLDVYGPEITAKVNGSVVARRQDSAITSGSIAIRDQGSPVVLDSVAVEHTIPASKQVDLSLPASFPAPQSLGLPSRFYCQRLENIDTGGVSQQRVVVSNASCFSLAQPITLPTGGDVKLWFTVSGPAAAQGRPVTMAMGRDGCPPSGDLGGADCGRELSASVPGSTPALTLIGADCANADPKRAPTDYSFLSLSFVSLTQPYTASLPSLDIRSAPPGNGSVFTTISTVQPAGGGPYEVSDILMPQGGAAALSYEGAVR